MNVRLFNVSRVFQIGETPTVVEPGPLVSQVDAPADVGVEIRRPDGTVTCTRRAKRARVKAGVRRHTRRGDRAR